MRIICGFMAVSMLAALSQPVLAACINRGGAVTCQRDPDAPKYPNSMQGPEKKTPAENPNTSGETTVLQPNASSDNAWVLTPQSTGGATVLSTGGTSAGTMVAACGSSTSC
jgi:hypothetical protein